MSGIIIHEWLERSGGAENVFEAMRRVFPDAESWCLWDDSDGRFPGVRESPLARTPLRRNKVLSLPLMPWLWRNFPVTSADWVLISSHLFAHHVRARDETTDIPKYVYAHTPPRYIWTPELDRRGASRPVRLASSIIKPLDRYRAREATAIAANSRFVAERIGATWEREASVIYPPVDTRAFRHVPNLDDPDQLLADSLPDTFLLALSRWVPYKNLEAAIYAGEIADIPVVIAGRGPDSARLRSIAAMASTPVTFFEAPSSALAGWLFHRAAVLVFTSVEDFGIVAVEAMASGTPVLVNAYGGASESVIDGATGAHVDDWNSPAALREGLDRAMAANPDACRARAAEFDRDVFDANIRRFVTGSSGPQSISSLDR